MKRQVEKLNLGYATFGIFSCYWLHLSEMYAEQKKTRIIRQNVACSSFFVVLC